MAYDDRLATRITAALASKRGITSKRMFGGIAWMTRGHMFAGIVEDALMLRVGPVAYEAMLARPHVRPMDFTGKPLRGYVYVDAAGIRTAAALAAWLERGLAFTATLPPKPGAAPRAARPKPKRRAGARKA
jgi:TfoX/Sxy family transcriptional regulator of competence genes